MSAKHTRRISDALDNGDFDYIDRLIEEEKAEKYSAADFDAKLKSDLEHDLEVLYAIRKLWTCVKRDPKLETFKKYVSENSTIKKSKILIFTESEETAEYLSESMKDVEGRKVFVFTGANNEKARKTVIENFDNNSKTKSDDYDILVTTDVLSE